MGHCLGFSKLRKHSLLKWALQTQVFLVMFYFVSSWPWSQSTSALSLGKPKKITFVSLRPTIIQWHLAIFVMYILYLLYWKVEPKGANGSTDTKHAQCLWLIMADYVHVHREVTWGKTSYWEYYNEQVVVTETQPPKSHHSTEYFSEIDRTGFFHKEYLISYLGDAQLIWWS